ncbi:HIT family protein [Ectobacillus antri]|uniref:HIT family protein n=1 Tax=Ectobacillus antri TaxID=2486280 RepID=UPI000F5B54C9|nr:HIT family protein [Ectobacillus antri]
MVTCPICEKHSRPNEVIYENENWLVTHGPLSSQILGYMYIEPKRHVEHWSDFIDEELAQLGPLVKRLEGALKQVLPVERVYTVTISEAVRHLHVHIIPRQEGQDMKGLPLIEQATQQTTNKTLFISKDQYKIFIKQLQTMLS